MDSWVGCRCEWKYKKRWCILNVLIVSNTFMDSSPLKTSIIEGPSSLLVNSIAMRKICHINRTKPITQEFHYYGNNRYKIIRVSILVETFNHNLLSFAQISCESISSCHQTPSLDNFTLYSEVHPSVSIPRNAFCFIQSVRQKSPLFSPIQLAIATKPTPTALTYCRQLAISTVWIAIIDSLPDPCDKNVDPFRSLMLCKALFVVLVKQETGSAKKVPCAMVTLVEILAVQYVHFFSKHFAVYTAACVVKAIFTGILYFFLNHIDHYPRKSNF